MGVGPLLSKYSEARPRVASFLDGFIVVSIGGLVLLDILPHALAHRDAWAVVAMALGFALPNVAERMLRYGVRRTHSMVLSVAFLGVAIHSMLDGSALAQSFQDPGSMLGYGVLLHQIPVGLMVWWVLQDRPTRLAWLVLLFMGVMTVLGYLVEPTVLALLPERAGLAFEALVGGSLLHVIGHSGHGHSHDDEDEHDHDYEHEHSHGRLHQMESGDGIGFGSEPGESGGSEAVSRQDLRLASGIGSLVGLGVLMCLELLNAPVHDVQEAAVAARLWSLILVAAPALLFSYGALAVFTAIGQARGRAFRFTDILGKSDEIESEAGALSLEATLLSVPLLGVPLAVVRLVLARVLLGFEASALKTRVHFSDNEAASREKNTKNAGVAALSLSEAWMQVVETSAPWVCAGLIAAAMLGEVIPGSWLVRLPVGWDVLLLAVAGMLFQVHAAALIPFAAVLIGAGISPGAALALLLTAPLPVVFTTVSASWRLGVKAVAGALLTAPVVAVASGFGINSISEHVRPWVWNGVVEKISVIPATIAALMVGAVMIWLLLRLGIRGFLEPLRRL